MNFEMFKLVLEKAEEPEIKLPTSAGLSKKQESSRKTSISALLTMPKPLTVWITINWKIFLKMKIPDHLTCLLQNLYAVQEETVRTRHGTVDWFQNGKGVCQGCILSLCLFSFHGEFSSVQSSSVTQSCPTLCDPMNRSTPGLPVHHQLPEFTQTHVHRVSDAIQPSHSVILFSCLQVFPASGPFQMSRLFASVK